MESKTTVTDHNCAMAMGSGDLPVFATPAMVALMENAAMRLSEQFVDGDSTTAGTYIAAWHTRASAIGQEITAIAKLIEQNGRELKFSITASDSRGEIGHADHTRFIVDRAKFLSKI